MGVVKNVERHCMYVDVKPMRLASCPRSSSSNDASERGWHKSSIASLEAALEDEYSPVFLYLLCDSPATRTP